MDPAANSIHTERMDKISVISLKWIMPDDIVKTITFGLRGNNFSYNIHQCVSDDRAYEKLSGNKDR